MWKKFKDDKEQLELEKCKKKPAPFKLVKVCAKGGTEKRKALSNNFDFLLHSICCLCLFESIFGLMYKRFLVYGNDFREPKFSAKVFAKVARYTISLL